MRKPLRETACSPSNRYIFIEYFVRVRILFDVWKANGTLYEIICRNIFDEIITPRYYIKKPPLFLMDLYSAANR